MIWIEKNKKAKIEKNIKISFDWFIFRPFFLCGAIHLFLCPSAFFSNPFLTMQSLLFVINSEYCSLTILKCQTWVAINVVDTIDSSVRISFLFTSGCHKVNSTSVRWINDDLIYVKGRFPYFWSLFLSWQTFVWTRQTKVGLNWTDGRFPRPLLYVKLPLRNIGLSCCKLLLDLG